MCVCVLACVRACARACVCVPGVLAQCLIAVQQGAEHLAF